MNNNLEQLNEACRSLSYTDMMCFKGLFIGALSALVEPEVWDKALKIVKEMKEEKK